MRQAQEGLAGEAKAGLIFGTLGFIALLIILIVLLYFRRRRKQQEAEEPAVHFSNNAGEFPLGKKLINDDILEMVDKALSNLQSRSPGIILHIGIHSVFKYRVEIPRVEYFVCMVMTV